MEFQPISNCDLRRRHVPKVSAPWQVIGEFALTFNAYVECGSFETCAAIANEHRHETLSDLRTCLFFEQRRWRNFGEEPDDGADTYIRSLVQRIHDALPDDQPPGHPAAVDEGQERHPLVSMSGPDSLAPDVGADISVCGQYRYRLTRRWSDGDVIAWLMLNPSTADATTDDPTIRRCVTFSKAWGYGALVVLNLFAIRATNPSDLPDDYQFAVGPGNDEWIAANAAGRRVVCAWGGHGRRFGRGRAVAANLALIAREVVCLGTTKGGHRDIRCTLPARRFRPLSKFEVCQRCNRGHTRHPSRCTSSPTDLTWPDGRHRQKGRRRDERRRR